MSQKPTLTDDEKQSLRRFQKRMRDLNGMIETTLEKNPNCHKWEWPDTAMECVHEARREAASFGLLERDLEKLLQWPTPELSDPSLFIEGKGEFSHFNRRWSWFEEMGFKKLTTPYTFADSWDRAEITATILVPKNLSAGHKAPIMWFFHGGGFCTGASDFVSWYSKAAVGNAKKRGAIIIAPDYPLGPNGNYTDIANAMRDFLLWYKEDGCFVEGEDSWATWLLKQIPGQNITIDKNRIFIEGESAGAHAAVTTMWINAEEGGTNLPINVALLRFPMIVHYARDFPPEHENGGKAQYMGRWYKRNEILGRAEKVKSCILELESYGLVPTCTSRYPPYGMAFAFLLSMSREWQGLFQRKHTPIGRADQLASSSESDNWDGMERARDGAGLVEKQHLPKTIVMYHGWDDGNCSIEDTRKFKNYLVKNLGYVDGRDVFLDEIQGLAHKKGNPEFSKDDWRKVGHAFDYYLDAADEPFLKEAYDKVNKAWAT